MFLVEYIFSGKLLVFASKIVQSFYKNTPNFVQQKNIQQSFDMLI